VMNLRSSVSIRGVVPVYVGSISEIPSTCKRVPTWPLKTFVNGLLFPEFKLGCFPVCGLSKLICRVCRDELNGSSVYLRETLVHSPVLLSSLLTVDFALRLHCPSGVISKLFLYGSSTTHLFLPP